MKLINQAEAKCPICMGCNTLLLCNSNEYEIFRCADCACDFVYPMPDEQSLKDYYDNQMYFHGNMEGNYTDYDLETEGSLSLFNDFLLTIPNIAEKKVLDIGCAFGTHLAMAAQLGCNSWGVELSSHAREIALSRHGDKIHVVENIASLPKLEFDLILIMDVVEHLPNPCTLFIELFLHGVVGKHTQFFITTPNARSADAIVNPSGWIYRYPPAHLLYFSAYSLELLLTNLGCSEINIQGIYPTASQEIHNYPDESNLFNQSFIHNAGLMCIAKGFDTFLYKYLTSFKDTRSTEIVKLYQEVCFLQKKPTQKYILAIQKHMLDEQHLNDIIKITELELKKNRAEILRLHSSRWYKLGCALRVRPITVRHIIHIFSLIIGLITTHKSPVDTTPNICRSFLLKIYKFFLILYSLRNSGNRQAFLKALNEYWNGVAKPQLMPILADATKSPYNAELLSKNDATILLVVHEFSRTGAPYAVLYLARALFSLYGIRPAIISPEDGPIRAEFEQEGFPTVVDTMLFNYQNYSSEAYDFVASFERVIVSSLASFGFISSFRGIGKHLTWWIHETNVGFSSVANITSNLPLMFAACESIWLCSPLCFPLALQFASQDKLHLLLYGCPDTAISHRPHQSGKIVFSIVGSVERRKGHDIFLKAVERLPEELRCKAIFRIIGSPLSNDESTSFYKEVCAKAALILEVECVESVPQDKLLEFYAENDVLVSASRDDPMPIVVTQGLMFSNVCLCSSAIGQSQLLENGKDSLIFTNESAEDLSDKMAWLIHNPDKLASIGAAGRSLYEKCFLMSSFVDNVGKLL
jgi:glycosyltransferase involved in cell wall biosynthesis